MMTNKGPAALEAAKKQSLAFKPVKLIYPHLTFDNGEMSLKVGKKNLILTPTPGHSADNIAVLIEEDRILFAGDAFMPLPYFVDGNIDELTASIKYIGKMGLENIVQGHGDIILRGEIDGAVRENLNYLSALRKAVKRAAKNATLPNSLKPSTLNPAARTASTLPGWQVNCTTAMCLPFTGSSWQPPPPKTMQPSNRR